MKWLCGYVVCSVKKGPKERFMNLCRHHHIELWNIYEKENVLYFNMAIRDYKKIKALAVKARVLPHLEHKAGLPMLCKLGRKHWTFVISSLIFLVLLYIFSTYIWIIEISGQKAYTKEMILEALNEMDVHKGMKRSRLECDKIETYLRKKYENLSWVSAEEAGSRLKIKVKEGTKTITSEKKEEPHHLIADVNGKVDSIITAVGTPKVKKGDNVKKGDILISGFVKMTDDNNEVVGRTAVPASGSVIVAAEVPFEKKIPKSYQKKVTAGSTKTIYDIELFGLAFSLKNPLKHLDKSYKYDIITTVCVDEPFEGFDFPVTVYKKECTPYERITAEYTKEEALKECEKAFDRYLSELKNSNCEIIDYSGIFDKTADGYLLTGKTKGLFTQTEQKKIEKQKMKKKKRREDTKDGENH